MTRSRFASSPALLTNAGFYGTLAAARSLGRYGVPVAVAHDGLLAPASWSRFVRQAPRCPPTFRSDLFLQWLLEYGADSPGHVLYPASDDTAFLFAAHRPALSKYYQLYQPPVEAVYALLNKRLLYEESRASGLRMPRTWFPRNAMDLAQIARQWGGPLVIKPATQILFHSRRKGELVLNAHELPARYGAFAAETYAPELLHRDPSVRWPVVQEFLPDAGRSIYSLSGFISHEGPWAMRGAMKVLQLPRQLGVGICFEDQAVEPELAEGIVSLCRRLGYYGVFEAEFICRGEERLLIDFNPRFFGQQGFDLARGLPLVILAYEAALGHLVTVKRLLHAANEWAASRLVPPVFCHKNALETLLLCQERAGSMPTGEASHWRAWLRAHQAVDAVIDEDDETPETIDTLGRYAAWARHPRAFMRSIVLNR